MFDFSAALALESLVVFILTGVYMVSYRQDEMKHADAL